MMSSSPLSEIESRISKPNNEHSTPSFQDCLLLSLIVASHFHKFSEIMIRIVVFFVVMIIASGPRGLKLPIESNPTLENQYVVSLNSRPLSRTMTIMASFSRKMRLSSHSIPRTRKATMQQPIVRDASPRRPPRGRPLLVVQCQQTFRL